MAWPRPATPRVTPGVIGVGCDRPERQPRLLQQQRRERLHHRPRRGHPGLRPGWWHQDHQRHLCRCGRGGRRPLACCWPTTAHSAPARWRALSRVPRPAVASTSTARCSPAAPTAATSSRTTAASLAMASTPSPTAATSASTSWLPIPSATTTPPVAARSTTAPSAPTWSSRSRAVTLPAAMS